MQGFLTGYQTNKDKSADVDSDSSKSTLLFAKPSSVDSAKVEKPWVEKYRPKTIDDVAHQEEAVKVLKNLIQNPAGFPNLLFYGKPGTGKTSAILAVAKQMFGNLYKERVLELNASDERGIQVVREKVKTFSQLACSSTLRSDGKYAPSFKLVILDEADSMTTAAQSALRRTMEKQCKNTRFCLICNYVSRIIDPITSRCMKFRFESLPKDVMMRRLQQIAECEKQIKVSGPEVYEEIIRVIEGDMRKSITLLQSASRFADEITVETISELAGVVPDDVIDSFISSTKQSKVSQLQGIVNDVILDGYPANQVLSQVAKKCLDDPFYTDIEKAKIFERVGVVDHRLNQGANEYLQLLDLATTLLHVSSHSNN